MQLGVDFGTTNSSIALYDGERLHPLLSDPANDNPYTTPSILYVDRAQHVTVGSHAAEVYMAQETGRPVRWRRRDAGEITVTVASVGSIGGDAPIEFVQPVNVLVDEAANGRLIQSIKTALFNPRYEGTHIFERYYRVEDLIALVLRHLRHAAETARGEKTSHIVLGRPVRFSDNPQVDSRAESILLKAAHRAGFPHVELQLEPVGVAHLYHRSSETRQTVLVFDFGGGTLDLSIAEVGGAEPPVILATGGLALGGDDLDRRIMRSLLPYFGGGDDGVLTGDMSDKLLAWQTMPELSRPRYIERIHRLKRSGHQETMQALETLISRNIGFRLFKMIEQVKKQLSYEESTTLDFEFEAVQIHETITRRRFDRMIAGDVSRVNASIEAILDQAGLRTTQIDRVLRTGGSSQIPAFGQLLDDLFGSDRVEATDPLISVTGGFAVMAYESKPPSRAIPELITEARSESGPLPVYRTGIDTKVYTDRDFTISRIPPLLNHCAAVQLRNDDHGPLELCLNGPARLYIAYPNTAGLIPRWLRGFTPEPVQIEIEDSFAMIRRSMQIYRQDYPAGLVTLGGALDDGAEGPLHNNMLVIARSL